MKGRHDCLISRHDISVAFFHAKGSWRVVIIPPKGIRTTRSQLEMHESVVRDTRGEHVLGQEVTDTLVKEGCTAVVVVPMMFVSENHGNATVPR